MRKVPPDFKFIAAELGDLRARVFSARERLSFLRDERQRLYDELLRVNQQCLDEERFVATTSFYLEEGKEIREGLAKTGAELEVRAAEVRDRLFHLRSAP